MKKKHSFMHSVAAAPHIVWSILFIIAPLLFVVYYSFTDAAGNFSFSNMQNLIDPNYLAIFLRSMCFAAVATAICLLIAYPIAYLLCKMKPRTQALMTMLIMLPMWMNMLIRTYSWMNILDNAGLINTILGKLGMGPFNMLGTSGAIVLGMVYNFLPYMVLPIHSVMSKLDKRYLEAAEDLGCSTWQVSTKIIFPLSLGGVISGITMVFVPSVSTFYISQKMGGGKFDLIGDTIERQFMSNFNYNMGASLSLILMVLIIISMAVMNRFGDGEDEVIV